MTLVEALISLVLSLVVTSTAMALVTPASRASMSQPEAMDVQQRARVAADQIARDLASAGAGVFAGPQSGLLTGLVPGVLPRQLGLVGDSPDAARADAITIISVPETRAQTTLAAPVSASALALTVDPSPNCGTSALCGLAAGDDVLLVDGAGHFDIFRVTGVAGGAASLRHHGQQLGVTYPIGSLVTAVTTRTYYLDAATRVVRQYDGDAGDQPAVDHVSSMSFAYFVDAPAGGLEPIALAALADGPWLGAGSSRFDADLLRVRMIRVALEAEASRASFRAVVPDMRVLVDVAPRAMGIR